MPADSQDSRLLYDQNSKDFDVLVVLLMAEILHQLIGSLSHYL